MLAQEDFNYELTAVLDKELGNLPYVRFYIQQDTLSIQIDRQMFPMEGQQNKIKLPFNQVMNEVVSQLNIMNKTISSNSRLTTSFLQNGKQIFSKKLDYLANFLDSYPLIKAAVAKLPPSHYYIFMYSMMALSNLILKLSINMAKISIVTISKLMTPAYLNIFTVSLLFQKFLQQHLLKSRQQNNSLQQKKNSSKQFPKVSMIKFSKLRNIYDSCLIKECQQYMFGDGSQNIQLIEFYQYDVSQSNIRNRGDSYGKLQSYDMMKQFGLSAPYGFQLYLFFSEIVINKLADFKPDIILFVDDYDNDVISILPQVKGLIINELSTRVQNKIYVFREFGVTQSMMTRYEGILSPDLAKYHDYHIKQEKMSMDNTNQTQSQKNDRLRLSFNYHTRNFSEEHLQQLIKQNSQFVFAVNHQLTKAKQEYYLKNRTPFLAKNNKKEDNQLLLKIKEMRKIMLDQLVYLSLALIQKSNFQEVLHEYRNYKFSPIYLQMLLNWMQNQHDRLKAEKVFTEVTEFYKRKMQKVKGMKSLTEFTECQNQSRTCVQIFNLQTQQNQILLQLKDNDVVFFSIDFNDTFQVVYLPYHIILFVFRQHGYNIYSRRLDMKYYVCQKQVSYQVEPYLSYQNSTLVYNKKYFYKAFGQIKNTDKQTNNFLNNNSIILKINIQKPQQIYLQKWQLLEKDCKVYSKEAGKISINNIPLEFKRYGYGFSYEAMQQGVQVNVVIMGGGFNFKIQNQEKVNKFLYIIRAHANFAIKVGKTNHEIVNQSQNLKMKAVIYPFVYGIPIAYNSQEYAVLNTNGYMENINHYKRIFLTHLRINSFANPASIGIVAQNKLYYDKQNSEYAITRKNQILSNWMDSINKINRLGNKVVLYQQKHRPIVYELRANEATDDLIVSEIQMREQCDNNKIQFRNQKLILMPPKPSNKK